MESMLDVTFDAEDQASPPVACLSDLFARKGFLVVRNALDRKTVEEVHRFLAQSVERSKSVLREAKLVQPGSDFSDALRSYAAQPRCHEIDHQTRLVVNGHFPLEVRLSKVLWKIPQNAKLRGFVRELLQADSLFVHMPPAARYVLPGNDLAGVPAHQDISYGSHMSDFITCWVPLTCIDSRCGGVIVYNGSSVREQKPTTKAETGWLEPLPTSGYAPIHCQPMFPGDVLFLNKWILHKSAANSSENIRISIDYRFFSSRDKSAKPYLDVESEKVFFPNEHNA